MILNNLDEIYQEVLEELSYRVGIINLRNKKHVDILSEILDTTKLAEYKSDILGELYKNVITEIDFQDKSAYTDYKSKHKMRPSTKVTIGDKETTVGAVSDTSKEKKVEPTTQSLDGLLSGIENTSNNTKVKEKLKNNVKKLVNVFDELSKDPKNPHAKSHKIVAGLMEKMFAGKVLSSDEKDMLHKFIRIAEPTVTSPNTTKFYIAKEPNNFKSSGSNKRDKVDFGSTPINGAFRQFTEMGGLSQMIASTFGTKLTTANQTFTDKTGKTKLLLNKDSKSIASVKKDKSGKVTSISIGTTQIERLDENEPNIKPEEKKIRERNNRNMDEYSKAIEAGDLNFIDMDNGVSPDSPENRVIVIQGALSGMANRLRNLAKKEGIGEERITNLIDSMETFSQRNPNDKPEQWFKDLNGLMSSIANDEGEPSLKECWANYAEVYSAIVEMHDSGKGTQNGMCALLPESTTLKTVDVITISNSGVGDRKIVTLDGRSVKKGVGAASGLAPKVEKSTYKDDKNGNKKKTIMKMANSYNDIYSVSLDESMDSHIQHQTNYRNEIITNAKSMGVSDSFINAVIAGLNPPKLNGKVVGSGVEAAVNKVEEQRKRDGLKADTDTMQKLRLRLQNYFIYTQLSHEAYNINVDVQDFSNDSILSQSGDRGGAELVKNKDIKIDSSDGVNILAYIRAEFNTGTWSNDGKSGNPGAGRFHNQPKQ
jgi:hypothetical protein